MDIHHSYRYRLDFFVSGDMKRLLFLLAIICYSYNCGAQVKPLGLRLEGYEYPYPVKYMQATVQQKPVQIAYMDVEPPRDNGRVVLLLHGKNFPAAYWEGVIKVLTKHGYRVIAPDALGFGKSSKPTVQYSFSLLALLTKQLLDHLEIDSVSIIAHSTGGMLGVRFALSYPERVEKLILEDPIGLEYWREKGAPYRSVDTWYKEERSASYDKIVDYQKQYYPEWNERYRKWANIQYAPLKGKGADQYALVSALTYDMIFTQPVIHEYNKLRMPVLLIVGKEDHTKIARDAKEEVTRRLGHVKQLAEKAIDRVPNGRLIEYDGVGHVPHLQIPERFYRDVLNFLR